LNEIKSKYHMFTSFFVSEKSKVYYQNKGILKTIKEEEARDEWYFRVSKMKPEYEINVDVDMANQDTLTVFINHKVFDYQGNYLGAAGVGLNIYDVKKKIEKYQNNYQRNIFFIDTQGNIVLNGTLNHSQTLNIKSIPWLQNQLKDILKSNNSQFTYKQPDGTYHVNTRYIPEFQWHLIVEQQEEKTIRTILNTLFLNLFICLLISIFTFTIIKLLIEAYKKQSEKLVSAKKLNITLLQSEITERKKAEEQIKSSLKEKETLLHEIHHRVKNNLAVISSLLNLQMINGNDEKLKEALTDSRNRIQTMATIHETLYQSDNLAAINMDTYLSKLASNIFQSYINSDRISLNVETDDIVIKTKQASSIGLIINELISNSLKHAFPDNQTGEINIRLEQREKDKIELIYADNGMGIPEKINWKESDSLGLQLIKTLVEAQLGGTIELRTDNGTCFAIKFELL
jgi:two-component sensor histidine kinase